MRKFSQCSATRLTNCSNYSLHWLSTMEHANNGYFQICGQIICDDYIELQPGAVSRLEQLLTRYCSERHDLIESSNAAKHSKPSRRQVGVVARCMDFCSTIWGPKGPSLPYHQRSKSSTAEVGVCSVAPGNSEGDHNFLLLCVPFMRSVAKLWQAEVCKISSDRDFFHVLRYYYNQHGRRFWARLRKVDAINFVKVSLHAKLLTTSFLIFSFYPSGTTQLSTRGDLKDLTNKLVRNVREPARGCSK